MGARGIRAIAGSSVTLVCIAMSVVVASVGDALAVAPGEINFQGLLLDSAGRPHALTKDGDPVITLWLLSGRNYPRGGSRKGLLRSALADGLRVL